MRDRRVSLGLRAAVIVFAVVVAALSLAPHIAGQTPPPVSLMSAVRAQAFVDAAARGLNYVPGEVVVKFASGQTQAARLRSLQAIRDRPGANDVRWLSPDTALVHDAGESDPHVLAQELASQSNVVYSSPNYIRHRSLVPNDPGYGLRQWNFQAIDMPHAWDINPGANPGITIAIVDTGITTFNGSMPFATWNGTAIQTVSIPFATNPDLSVSRLVKPMDFVTNMGTTVLDTDGHGTHVSGTAGEDTNNDKGDAGIAYNAHIMPVKVCASYWDVQFSYSASGGTGFVPMDSGGCDDGDIIAGINYAASNGAKIINLSLGGPGDDPAILDALKSAVASGVFISMAAGNDQQNGNPTEYPAAYAANLPGAMSVAASNHSGTQAYYSSSGSYIEIAAPGGDDEDNSDPDLAYIWQVTLTPSSNDQTTVIIPRFDQYAEVGYEGTSMATAHVTGAAALIMAQGVTSPAVIEALLKRTANLPGSTTPGSRNDNLGSGIVQPRAALFGFGVKQ